MQNRVLLVEDDPELRQLLARAGSVVRKTDLMQRARGRRLASHDRTLDMHISNLRRKLGDDDLPRIETVRGLGYSYRSTS